jgi:phage baseplate assembly protein W
VSIPRIDVAFPYAVDQRGATTHSPSYEAHVRDLIEQVLFTTAGERVNRPDFGSGLLQLVFAPAGEELLASTRLLLQSNLQRWLGDLITVEGLDVTSEDAKLAITLRYVVLSTGQRQQERFVR